MEDRRKYHHNKGGWEKPKGKSGWFFLKKSGTCQQDRYTAPQVRAKQNKCVSYFLDQKFQSSFGGHFLDVWISVNDKQDGK